MSKIIGLVAAIFLFGVAMSQVGGTSIETVVVNNQTYTASDIDTTATYNIGGYSNLWVQIRSTDSCNAVLTFDYRTKGATSWTAVTVAAGDTFVTATNTGAYYSVKLIDNTTQRITSAGAQLRIRIGFEATANGVTSPKYYVRLFGNK